jgi:cation transport protein ChaC
MTSNDGDLWIFGYGSLMWRPGFPYEERHAATLAGLHRSLCVFSHVHRGTPDRPGLVMGLDRGGACRGVAFRVAENRRDDTLAYLREREQVTSVYVEAARRIRLDDGRSIHALVYIVNQRHPQYAGRLAADAILALVRQGIGRSGPNPDYVVATHRHLLQLGVCDPMLTWLYKRLEATPADTSRADPADLPSEGAARS